MSIDRLPPHAIEAEQGVLSCLLLDSKAIMPEAVEMRLTEDWFYDLRHRKIFQAIQGLDQVESIVDLVTVAEDLRTDQHFEAIGGLPYLARLLDVTPSPANFSYYAEILREKFTLRQIIQVCTAIVVRAYEAGEDYERMLGDAEREILAIRKAFEVEQEVGMKELVGQALEAIEAAWLNKGQTDGIPTGFPDLDGYTGGLHKGELCVLAAYPGIGKSAFAMNIAEHVILQSGLPVGVFTLEMTALQLVTRCIASHSRVNLRNVSKGFLSERDFPKLTVAAGKLSRAAMWFDDGSDLSIFQLRAKARRMHQKHGIKLWIVDYIQLMNATGGAMKNQNREQEVATISRGLKALAKETNAPVLALSQLNKEGNLRDSGAIGQDADSVWKLNAVRGEDDEDTGEERDCEPVDLWIAKQRNGPKHVSVHFTFFGPYTRFESAARVVDEPEPENPPQRPAVKAKEANGRAEPWQAYKD